MAMLDLNLLIYFDKSFSACCFVITNASSKKVSVMVLLIAVI